MPTLPPTTLPSLLPWLLGRLRLPAVEQAGYFFRRVLGRVGVWLEVMGLSLFPFVAVPCLVKVEFQRDTHI